MLLLILSPRHRALANLLCLPIPAPKKNCVGADVPSPRTLHIRFIFCIGAPCGNAIYPSPSNAPRSAQNSRIGFASNDKRKLHPRGLQIFQARFPLPTSFLKPKRADSEFRGFAELGIRASRIYQKRIPVDMCRREEKQPASVTSQ